MKKDQIFPKSLLLSQEETAILLGIHRSQWAMYEINQRSLPTDATIRLADLLTIVNELSLEGFENRPLLQPQRAEKEKMLRAQIASNQLKQLRLQRKLARVAHKFQEAAHTLLLVEVYKEKEPFSDLATMVLHTMQTKALAALQRNGLHLQTKFQLKLQALEAHTHQLELALSAMSS
jgi:hypothetical protein